MTRRWVMRRLRSPNSYVVPGALALAMALSGSPALAQDDPEAGDTSWGQQQPATQPAMGGGFDSSGFNNNYAQSNASAGAGEAESGKGKARGNTDHDAVLKSWSLGLLGLAELPVALGDPLGSGVPSGERTITSDTVVAPVIGTRYWVGKRVGIEAGLGFSIQSGSRKIAAFGIDADGGSITAVGAHFGLPIAAAYGKHYTLLMIPYLAYGYVSSEDSRSTDATNDDVFGTATVFEGGLRAGVEIQLGAIGLENFALQLTTGIRLRYESRTANVPLFNEGMPAGDADRIAKDLRFETSAGSTLGSAVAGTLAALYYF